MTGLILQPSTGPADWQRHLAEPNLHWKPGRSAMETAMSWEGAKGLPAEIGTVLPGMELLQAIVEYPVFLPGGGNVSKNDVFALLRDDDGLIVCMVEAKRDEPFGPRLSEWLLGASEGKRIRLKAICDCLGLDSDAVPGSTRYQLLHRAASAVLTARAYRTTRAIVLVQSFSPEARWFADFAFFCGLFGREAGQGRLVSAELPGNCSLELGWVTSPLMATPT